MRFLGRITTPLWIAVIGIVVVYAFFVTLASVPLGRVAGTTVAVGALALLFAIRSLRISSELADRGGNPALRRARNRARERRGF